MERLSPPRPLVGEPHPEETLEAPELRSLRPAAKQSELLPQPQVLEREVRAGSERRTQRAQQSRLRGTLPPWLARRWVIVQSLRQDFGKRQVPVGGVGFIHEGANELVLEIRGGGRGDQHRDSLSPTDSWPPGKETVFLTLPDLDCPDGVPRFGSPRDSGRAFLLLLNRSRCAHACLDSLDLRGRNLHPPREDDGPYLTGSSPEAWFPGRPRGVSRPPASKANGVRTYRAVAIAGRAPRQWRASVRRGSSGQRAFDSPVWLECGKLCWSRAAKEYWDMAQPCGRGLLR